VLADRIVDPRRRYPVTILEDRVERHAVVFLGQVLADRHEAQAVPVETAESGMMAGAPWQEAVRLAGDRLHDRPGAAAELEGVAAHKAAHRVGFVELLAPQA